MNLNKTIDRLHTQPLNGKSESENTSDLLMRLNEENKRYPELNRQLTQQNEELTKQLKTNSREKTQLKEELLKKENEVTTLKDENIRLEHRPKQKEYITRYKTHIVCERCNIDEVKSELKREKKIKLYIILYAVLFSVAAAFKNHAVRADIFSFAKNFSFIVCRCRDFIRGIVTTAANVAHKINHEKIAAVLFFLLKGLMWLVVIILFYTLLWLAAYGIVNLLKKYWDNVYTAFSVGYAALLILFWDIPDFSVNCLIVYALLMIVTVVIRIIMNKT